MAEARYRSPDLPRTVSHLFTRGHLTSIPGWASSIGYHANGLVSSVAHSNGVTWSQAKDPNDMQRPQRISTSGASDDLDSGIYAYDGAGNVTAMGADRYTYDVLSRVAKASLAVAGAACGQTTTVQGTTDTGTRDYESCGTVQMGPSYTVGATGDVTARAGERVVLADGFSVASGGRFTAEVDPSLAPSVLHERQYGYDLFGNLTSHTTTVDGGSGDLQTMPVNAATNRLSAASYDSSGNVTSWGGWSYDHDPFDMLRQTNGHTFVYAPGDERIWSVDWTGGTDPSAWKETWTLRDLDGRPLRQFRTDGGNSDPDHWTLWRDYVWRGGTLLAAETPDGRIHYHPYHLGSPRLITDVNGAQISRHLYYPFGEEIPVTFNPFQEPEVLKFTGHERDDLDPGGGTADLDYMHARYYSPHLGRFMSVDPKASAKPLRPQTWNSYAYVRSNPLKFIDPDGGQEGAALRQDRLVQQLLDGEIKREQFHDQIRSDAGAAVLGATAALLLRGGPRVLPTPGSTDMGSDQPCAGPCGSDPKRRPGVAPGRGEPEPQAIPGQRAKEKGGPPLRPADPKDKMQPPSGDELLKEAEDQMKEKPERQLLELAIELINALFGSPGEPPPE